MTLSSADLDIRWTDILRDHVPVCASWESLKCWSVTEIGDTSLLGRNYRKPSINNILTIQLLREKCPNTKPFLVRIFLHSDWIRSPTHKCPYSAQTYESMDQKKLCIWSFLYSAKPSFQANKLFQLFMWEERTRSVRFIKKKNKLFALKDI